tara:strand:+ start:139 stop:270 length:132 start_codon:yes stop_codon:yes gene_type:complete
MQDHQVNPIRLYRETNLYLISEVIEGRWRQKYIGVAAASDKPI